MKHHAVHVLALALLLSFPSAPYASGHARVHQWNQDTGNLLLNWSFENRLEFWNGDSIGGIRSWSRIASGDAVSGRFTGKVAGTTLSAAEQAHLESPLVPVVPGENYTLSFWVRSEGEVMGSAAPAVFFWETLAASSGMVTGVSHRSRALSEWGGTVLSWWTLQRLSFTVPAGVTRITATLWRSMESGAGGTLFFDDVVLEEGDLSAAAILERRGAHAYTVSYHDALGRRHQSQTPAPENSSFYRVEGVEYDSAGHPVRVPLPVAVQMPWPPSFVEDLASTANDYHAVPNAYTERVYASDPAGRIVEVASPGQAWALSGGRTLRRGFRFVSSLSPPADIESLTPVYGEHPYLLEWSRDEDSALTLSWINRREEVVQTASQTGSASFAFTRMEYTPAGRLRRLLTPLDVASADSGLAETFTRNAQGLVTSAFGPDRGLRKFWYNKDGILRYSQNEEQRERGTYFTYYDHDAFGNLVSTGEQFLYNPPYPDQEYGVDGPGEPGLWGKEEHRGFLYGDVSSFVERTGIPLDSLDGELGSLSDLGRFPFMLTAAWHRNPMAGEQFNARTALVADFYRHDNHGRLSRQHKYLGAAETFPVQSIRIKRDTLGRATERLLHEGVGVTSPMMRQGYSRDALGRIRSVSGLYGDTVARYTRAYDGRLESEWLGGEDYPEAGLEIHYDYHVRGWLASLEVVSGHDGRPVFRQFLGYEKRAMEEAGVPPLSGPRYGGQVSQQLYGYLWDVPNPLRVVNYTYDEMRRLTTSNYLHGSGSFGYAGNLVFPVNLADVPDLDARLEYDLNGRIVGKRAGGISSADSAVFAYNWNSYQLDHVQGKLSSGGDRDVSNPMTFGYDAAGNLAEDRSKAMAIEYSHDGMPVRFRVGGGENETVLYPFYDADGHRASLVAEGRLARGFPVYVAGTHEGAEPDDLYTSSDFADAWSDANYLLNFQYYPPPDSLVVYVVADSGESYSMPDTTGYGVLYRDTVEIPVVVRGMAKYSATYDSLRSRHSGRVLAARHVARLAGKVMSEYSETFDETGEPEDSRITAAVFGREAPVGRYLPDEERYQFFIKNHLGSTMRVIEGDGSYYTLPAFDYQPYGGLQIIREDSLRPVSAKFTGKELDTVAGLYYFGARWYDQDLGMWITPDPAGQFRNPYTYGGDPVNFTDDDGRVIVWANGVGGADSPETRRSLCENNPSWCDGTNSRDAALHARNYGHGFLRDLRIATNPFAAMREAGNVYSEIRRARQMNRNPSSDHYGTGVHVVAHSGGASTSGYATGWFNLTHGYGSVDSRTTVAGWDPLALGRNFSYITGTRTRAHYNAMDPISHAAATNDLVFGIDPDSKLDVVNLDHWCMEGHENADPGCRSLNDMLKDQIWGYEWGISKPAEHIGRGMANGYDDHLNPFTYARNTYTFWRDFDWRRPSSYGDVLLLGHRKRDRILKDFGKWIRGR